MRLAFASRNRYLLLSSSSSTSTLIPCHSSTILSKFNSIHLSRFINMSHSHDKSPGPDCSYLGWERQALVDKIKELQEQVNNHNTPSNNNNDHSVDSESRTNLNSGSNQAHQAKTEPNRTDPSTSTSTSSNPNPSLNLNSPKPKKKSKSMDFSKVSQRKIALRFSYDGSYYSGLAIQNYQLNPNPISNPKPDPTNNALPTVEEILWKALCKSRLVDESKGMSGCGFERCGRTDKGVSAAGQVVSLWIRSRRIDMSQERFREEEIRRFREEEKRRRELRNGIEVQDEVEVEMKDQDEEELEFDQEALLELDLEEEESHKPSIYSFGKSIENEELTELPYLSLLNKILPDSIRINAWSPVRPDFSARFDCRYRHYKYFFTRGASHQLIPLVDPRINSVASTSKVTLDSSSNPNPNDEPSPSPSTKANTQEIKSTYTYPTNGTGPELSISKMRNAASRLLGEHDFRNLCKVDPTKQITNFIRRIDGVSIDLVGKVQVPFHLNPNLLNRSDPSSNTTINENVYVLNLRGTAFLYHQVRHIVALLFLVGSRLEEPNIIDRLLNVKKGQVEEDWEKLIRRGLNVEKWIENSSQLEQAQDQHQYRDEFPTILPNSTADTKGGHTAASALNAVKTSFIKSPSSSGNANVNVNPNSNYITQEELIKMNEILTTKSKSRSMKNVSDNDGLEEMNERIREYLEKLDVFESKPSYEMAEDRPLMLWDCGFRENDVQWRSGGYDGPIDLDLLEKQSQQQNSNNNINHVPKSSNGPISKNKLISNDTSSHSSTYLKHLEAFNYLHHQKKPRPQLSETSIQSDLLISSTRSLAINHSIWVKSLIDSEIKKHFLLSNPLFNGVLKSSTFFQDSRLGLNVSENDGDLNSEDFKKTKSTVVPIGYGNSRPALEYTKLEKRKRDELVEEKNRRWREGTGKRKAEKKMIKGGEIGGLEMETRREKLNGIEENKSENKEEIREIESQQIEEKKEETIKRPQPRVVDMDERKVRGGPRIMDREIEKRFR